MASFTIVTGASSNHFRPLRNLLRSLALHEPEADVEVWDLGLTPDEHETLAKAYDVHRFDFSRLPPHCNFHQPEGRHGCAWKPPLIADRLEAHPRGVLWLDAGNLVHAPLRSVRQMMSEQGLYFHMLTMSFAKYAHPQTLERLAGQEDAAAGKRMALAGLVGFTRRTKTLLDTWKRAALDLDTIRPPGWTRKLHRGDQVVLSVLLHRMTGPLKNGWPLEISWLNDDLDEAAAWEKCQDPGRAGGRRALPTRAQGDRPDQQSQRRD